MNHWIILVAGLALLFREHVDNDARDLVDIPIQALCTRENRARFSQSLLVLVHTTSPQVLSCVQSPGRKPGLIAVWSRSVMGWGTRGASGSVNRVLSLSNGKSGALKGPSNPEKSAGKIAGSEHPNRIARNV